MKPINKIVIILLLGAAIAGCKKSFLDRPNVEKISATNYYQSSTDLRLATASLYGGAPWFQWQQPWLLLGDVLPGTAFYSYYGDLMQLYTRTITSQNGIVSSAWSGLYNVIGQCNMVIYAINNQSSASLSPTVKNQAIAEARFIRAMAYYHLAVYWGAVPIIEDNNKLLTNALLYRNTVPDVYKFVTKDLTFAAQNLPLTDEQGRVTTWSAQGMLGKVYLTMSGLGHSGSRDQALLDSAKKYAGNVCKNSGLVLFSSYYDLFRTQYNDNPESLFALQWAAGVGYGNGNVLETYYSPSNIINAQKSGGWQTLQPTWDLYSMYSAKDTVRRKATIMLTGDYYPELNAAGGGYTAGGNAMKKHIVGNEKDNGSPQMTMWSSPEHPAMLRLADVYLVYAEAILGNNSSTANGDALLYFNKVRARAGVDPAPMLTADTILRERRVELAFEGQYWIDLVRRSYYDPAGAVKILNDQDLHHAREQFSYDPKTRIATRDTTAAPSAIPATINTFTMQIPASELSTDPKLAQPPVPYY
ncbi:RagB/SusD family nutrient uptake outer membrane protein [Mucilaginibacter sp. BJC16-A38]|uniref:RagB/SusD family nutrient uptake outer membrane protein n=1 Tax=Mucilaginibacter phenanthrenivorans TaxID=1234842 RepID=UPI0021584F18|nr:RagB/SusD family nutrient uptake outer membrane protein [Mucilaginibacter phenanthrenivorans]MCR8557212.1 RagB/SusD family nutrient uptake outer membrane protein [Mucilaginibacter phenanthrenivorans]